MTKTVSYANVHLSYTADLAGLRQAKSDMAAMNRVINQAKTDTQRYEEHVQKLDRLLANGKISQEQYNKALEAARTKFLTAGQAAKGYANAISSLNLPGSGFMAAGPLGAAGLASAALTAGGLSLAKDSINAYGDLQMTLTALEVIYGDAALAAKDFATMRQMAAVSPLETSDFTKAAVVMAQYGVAVETIVPRLKALAEIAAGDSQKMQTLSLAFGQVAASGRLMGQEVLQMVNAGFNPLAEISRTTGRSMQDLKKDMENGLITFDMVAKAFDTATEAGGRFNGMNEKLGKTINAQLAQLRDEWTKTKEAFGEALAEGGVIDTLKAVSSALKDANHSFSVFNKHGADQFGFSSMWNTQQAYNTIDAYKELFDVASPGKQADIERMKKESDDLQAAQERMGSIIAGAVSSVPDAIATAGQTYASAMAAAEEAARAGAQAATRADVKRRAEAEKARNKIESSSKMTAELPTMADFGSREAFAMLNDLAQHKADLQLQEMQKQNALAADQVSILRDIKNNTGRPTMGIV